MRKWILAGVGVVATLAAFAVTVVSPLAARQAADPKKARPAAQPAEESRVTQLPVGRVVLFSSGVGYFQREGTVEGDARVDLNFPVGDINDLIKSMVVRDLDGGAVSTVSYDSNAPIDRTLKSFAVNLSSNPTFADVLNQARGERVEVALANAGSGNLTGTVVGVEKSVQVTADKATVTVATLNLWCADGMRGVRMSEVQRVRFLDAQMEQEFRKALETLAQSHDVQKKAVSVRFEGEGRRRVSVGYVVENPIWKTSYRLVMNAKGDEKPYLQGWAVVENTSDEDWKDVRMSLVSGRPVSFKMDLYTPLYVPRPTETLELFAGLRSVVYGGAMDSDRKQLEGLGAMLEDSAPAEKSREAKDGLAARRPGVSAGAMPMAKKAADSDYFRRKLEAESRERMNLGGSVSSAATAAKLGDFFQYAIDRPVQLGRQKSALLPIVAKDVQAARVSIYNERSQAKFPMLGLRFKNTSGVHLMQGPVTVFEGGNYAGDARVLDVQPNEERLMSYAMDLGTEVVPAPVNTNGRVLKIKAVKGVVYTTTKVRDARTYTIKNRNDQERTVLVEHPLRRDFSLVDIKPTETTADLYRFEVKVPVNATKTLAVNEERDVVSTISITTSSDEQIRLISQEAVTSEKVKTGLKSAVDLRLAIGKTTREIGELQRQLNTIVEDQTRLRANLKEMPATAAAYKRYLDKFDKQETEIEKYRDDIKKLQATEHSQRKEFEDFLANFSAE